MTPEREAEIRRVVAEAQAAGLADAVHMSIDLLALVDSLRLAPQPAGGETGDAMRATRAEVIEPAVGQVWRAGLVTLQITRVTATHVHTYYTETTRERWRAWLDGESGVRPVLVASVYIPPSATPPSASSPASGEASAITEAYNALGIRDPGSLSFPSRPPEATVSEKAADAGARAALVTGGGSGVARLAALLTDIGAEVRFNDPRDLALARQDERERCIRECEALKVSGASAATVRAVDLCIARIRALSPLQPSAKPSECGTLEIDRLDALMAEGREAWLRAENADDRGLPSADLVRDAQDADQDWADATREVWPQILAALRSIPSARPDEAVCMEVAEAVRDEVLRRVGPTTAEIVRRVDLAAAVSSVLARKEGGR